MRKRAVVAVMVQVLQMPPVTHKALKAEERERESARARDGERRVGRRRRRNGVRRQRLKRTTPKRKATATLDISPPLQTTSALLRHTHHTRDTQTAETHKRNQERALEIKKTPSLSPCPYGPVSLALALWILRHARAAAKEWAQLIPTPVRHAIICCARRRERNSKLRETRDLFCVFCALSLPSVRPSFAFARARP